MAKAVCKVPAATLALYDTLLATNPCVKRKGAASAYTSLNGHMFSFMTEAGTLALRLPTDAREAFLKKYSTKLCVQYGTVMKEYVEVPAALLRKTQVLQYVLRDQLYPRRLARTDADDAKENRQEDGARQEGHRQKDRRTKEN
jgi:hypothetical protein